MINFNYKLGLLNNGNLVEYINKFWELLLDAEVKINQQKRALPNVEAIMNESNNINGKTKHFVSMMKTIKEALYEYIQIKKKLSQDENEYDHCNRILKELQEKVIITTKLEELKKNLDSLIMLKGHILHIKLDTNQLFNQENFECIKMFLITSNDFAFQLTSLLVQPLQSNIYKQNLSLIREFVNEYTTVLNCVYETIISNIWNYGIKLETKYEEATVHGQNMSSEQSLGVPTLSCLTLGPSSNSNGRGDGGIPPSALIVYTLCTILKCNKLSQYLVEAFIDRRSKHDAEDVEEFPTVDSFYRFLPRTEPFKTFFKKLSSQYIEPLFVNFGDKNFEESCNRQPSTFGGASAVLSEVGEDRLQLSFQDLDPEREKELGSFSARARLLLRQLGVIFDFLDSRLGTLAVAEALALPPHPQNATEVRDEAEDQTASVASSLLSFIQHTALDFDSLIGSRLVRPLFETHLGPYYTDNCPTDIEELPDFQSALTHLKAFEDDLIERGFLTRSVEGEEGSEGFADRIRSSLHSTFAAKVAAKILDQGRRLILGGSLHDTIDTSQGSGQATGLEPAHGWPIAADALKGRDHDSHNTSFKDLSIQTYLSSDSFLFPPCQISRHVDQLWNLIKVTAAPLTSADSPTDSPSNQIPCSAQRTLDTVVKLLDIYLSLSPRSHGSETARAPLLAGIYLNNCSFLAYQISNLQIILPSAVPDLGPLAYASRLTDMGLEAFAGQLKVQTETVTELLKDYFPAAHDSVDEITFRPNDVSLKRFVNHLDTLRKVWEPCLPTFAAKRSIGILLESGLLILIDGVLGMEDISEESSQLLSQQLTLLEQSVRKTLFPERDRSRDSPTASSSTAVSRYCSAWSKFLGLIQVLILPMVVIADAWSSKVPASDLDEARAGIREFSGAELRHLIRALFQNTEKRREVLGKMG